MKDLWDLVCPKCGSNVKSKIKYVYYKDYEEYMQIICICNYIWKVAPMDAMKLEEIL
jgi:hypothetical protein